MTDDKPELDCGRGEADPGPELAEVGCVGATGTGMWRILLSPDSVLGWCLSPGAGMLPVAHISSEP